MTQVPLITRTNASSDDINDLIDKIEAALEGADSSHVVIALLALTVMLQKPDISHERLQEVLMDASRLISMSLAESETLIDGSLTPAQIN